MPLTMSLSAVFVDGGADVRRVLLPFGRPRFLGGGLTSSSAAAGAASAAPAAAAPATAEDSRLKLPIGSSGSYGTGAMSCCVCAVGATPEAASPVAAV